jgi:GH15 family glucan-1,4-alpha-glucosidase
VTETTRAPAPAAPGIDVAAARAAPHVLREYAVLADGERGVVVGPRGDVAWLCFPRWDDDALFCSLLGGAGGYELHPEGRFVWGGFYEPGGLIWRSRWATDDGIVECREALALPARPDRAVVLRRLIARRGPARVAVVLDVRSDFGSFPTHGLHRDDDGTWRGRTGDVGFAWTGGAAARVDAESGALSLSFVLDEGTVHDFVLVLAAGDAGAVDAPQRLWRETEATWRERVPELSCSTAARDARHAYAAMSGLTSAGGGMVAAATTSLPERARAGRNYDYRYAWIRDQCYAGRAAARSGAPALLDAAVRFVGARLLEDGPGLRPAYTTSGRCPPEERELPLPGYPGGTAIVGNRVNRQFQLDGFGEALLLFSAAAEQDHLDADGWRAADIAADAIEARWRDADAGIWELDDAKWTHSRLICAAGLRAIAARRGRRRAARRLALADRIVADTAACCVHPSGRWQRAPSDARVDAALLLPAIRGAIPANDPRSLATLRAVRDELCVDGYAYRFRPDARPLGEAEGAFLLCGFVMALALDQQGDHVGAARWFERNRAACGPPGLLSEEFDVRQRQLRGNLPQAFVHALLLECAVTQDATTRD